jgi:hypothetical protein
MIPPFEVTLLEDVPELAARRGDVLVVRPELPNAAVILWRRLSFTDTNRLLTASTARVDFMPPSPSVAPGARNGSRQRRLALSPRVEGPPQ